MSEITKLTNAALDVLAERRRQVEAEGWTAEHDDRHDKGELADAASVYAATFTGATQWWPWWTIYRDQSGYEVSRARAWWKPTERRRDLVKAGALILAEIERLDRAATVSS